MDIIIEYILANYIWILVIVIIVLLAIVGWYADKTNFGQGKSTEEEKEKSIEDLKKELGDKKLFDEINGSSEIEEQKDLEEKKLSETDLSKNIPNQNELDLSIKNTEMNFDPMTGEPINTSLNQNYNEPVMNFDPMTGEPIKKEEISDINSTKEVIVGKIDKIEPIQLIEEQNEVTGSIDIFGHNFDSFEKTFNEIVPKKGIVDENLLDEIDNLTFEKTQKISFGEIPDLDDIDLPQIKQI